MCVSASIIKWSNFFVVVVFLIQEERLFIKKLNKVKKIKENIVIH